MPAQAAAVPAVEEDRAAERAVNEQDADRLAGEGTVESSNSLGLCLATATTQMMKGWWWRC